MCALCGCGVRKNQVGYGKGKPSAKKETPEGRLPPTKQSKIAGKAGDPKKINSADLTALRKKK